MPATATTTAHTAVSSPGSARELDHRCADGIDVTLLWGGDERLVVFVSDERTGETFALEAPPARALDVFRHPFAYAA